MSTNTLRRGGPGPDRTQFAGSTPTPAETTLIAGGVTSPTAALVDDWLTKPGKSLPFGGRDRLIEALADEDQVDEVTIGYWHRKVAAELAANSLNNQDLARVEEAVEVLDQVGRSDLAKSVARTVENAYQVQVAGADGTSTASLNDPRVENGEIFDRLVDADGTVFERVRPGFEPYYPGTVRFQADRVLSAAEAERFAQLVGYAHKSVLHSQEDLGDPKIDSLYSLTFSGMSRLKGENFQAYIDTINTYLAEGSPERQSAGYTRLIEGMENPPAFELYYAD
ncbi:hypothetical protein [Agromyces humi]|uniref:hypothetical protein n=1 Tax=Agromyces humi TaxID=1766800 RepID=UPI00135701BD|nr:hypothetical protein [Agromyces humi]